MSIYKEYYDKEGNRRFKFVPHIGQLRALESEKKIIAMIAGTQGGKTSFGPLWLLREMKRKGAGDYMVITPTYGLLSKKALPEFLSLFDKNMSLGTYRKGDKVFYLSAEGERKLFGKSFEETGAEPTRVMFGYAGNPESLESATAKAVWCDEAGQKSFKVESWEALQRRLSIYQGRCLITTTPYNLGWLKTRIYDPWIKSGKDHPYIDVIRFRSTVNPSFPQEEYERVKATMPAWRFKMFYDAIFSRPEGMIYNMFDDAHCVVRRFEIPRHWAVYVGMDFGGVNTVALFYAMHPDTKDLYLFKTYKRGNIPAKEHAKNILHILSGHNFVKIVGGSSSEIQWRKEFSTAGLPVKKPDISDLEVGIDKVIEAHSQNRIYVFDDLEDYLEEKNSYRRELDEEYNPTETIENKSTFHHMDGERYIISSIHTHDYGYEEMKQLSETNENESEFW